MKNFDLAAAKRGATVCTREGWPVRILCFDCRMKRKGGISCPIVAEVFFKDADFKNGNWAVAEYDLNGKYRGEDNLPHYNLMMADDDYLEKLERGEYGNSNIETPDWHGPHRIMTTEQIATQPFASISDENYWRRMYAGMAMQGLMSDNRYKCMTIKYADLGRGSGEFYNLTAKLAVGMAEALIEELKKKK